MDLYFYRNYGAIDRALMICFKRILNYNQNKKKKQHALKTQ